MRTCMLQKLFGLLTIISASMWGVYFLSWGPHVQQTHTISILVWYWPFGDKPSMIGDVCWENYRIPGCHLHDNRSMFNQADVVVFHQHDIRQGLERLPLHLQRPAGQMWLWVSVESPTSNGNLSKYAGIFNWTMSYRHDADVYIPYGELQPREHGEDTEGEEPINTGNKSHLACWVVSNYHHQHERTRVYRHLQKLLPVQVYGRPFRKPLDAPSLLPTISRCYFYLAFENSQHKEYITEKLWRNAFQGGAVPVVLGPPRADYEAVAPPRSFIHVQDFDTLERLAQYLKQVATNATEYSKYHQWRRHHQVKLYTDFRLRFCLICARYHTLPTHKVYHDLEGWANL